MLRCSYVYCLIIHNSSRFKYLIDSLRFPHAWMHYLMLSFLRSGNKAKHGAEQAMSRKFDGKWGTECLNIRFTLPTMLYVGYSKKNILSYFLRILILCGFFRMRRILIFLGFRDTYVFFCLLINLILLLILFSSKILNVFMIQLTSTSNQKLPQSVWNIELLK